MAHHIFQLETELQNIPEAAPKASPGFSLSEMFSRCGSSVRRRRSAFVGRKSRADFLTKEHK
jgi:hypothetical protein